MVGIFETKKTLPYCPHHMIETMVIVKWYFMLGKNLGFAAASTNTHKDP
jgi:hypothetical protein